MAAGRERFDCSGYVKDLEAVVVGVDLQVAQGVRGEADDFDVLHRQDLGDRGFDSLAQDVLSRVPGGDQRFDVEDHRPGSQLGQSPDHVAKIIYLAVFDSHAFS